MKDSYICYDCQRVTSGDCGQHGPRVLVTYPGAPKPEPAPAESRADRLRDALAAARDVLVAEQKEMGWLPQQQAWSTKMTAAELRIAEAVRSIDAILADDEPEPAPASVGGPLLDLESFEDRAYQRGVEAGRAEMLTSVIAWHMDQAEEESGHLPYSGKRYETHMKAINALRGLRLSPSSPSPAPLVGEKEK